MTNVLYEARDKVALVTLNRPEKLNALSPELLDELSAALNRAGGDREVRVVVIRGEGRAFSTGYDLEAFANQPLLGPESWRERHRRNIDRWLQIWNLPKPVIAQVHGYCVGGGSDLALCSDLIVCAQDATFGYPPARVWGSPTTAMWTYRLGLERSKRLLLTGDALDGRRAVEWGLASEAVPADELDAAGLALARRVARLPVNQLHMMKLLVNATIEQMGLATTQLLGTLLDGAARHTPEGVAFSEAALQNVAGAVRARDEPFGDYAFERRPAG